MLRSAAALVLALVLTSLASHPVSATPPDAATLTTEMFFTADTSDIPPFVTDCDQSGESTFTYTVRGPAYGTYPGTFTETGTVTMGPHFTEMTPVGPFTHATVTSWTANFEVVSARGTVRGTKWFEGAPVGFGFSRCVDGPPAVMAPFTDHSATTLLRYEAKIHTDQGVFWDRGITTAWPSQCNCATGNARVASFIETYRSDLVTASRGRGENFRP